MRDYDQMRPQHRPGQQKSSPPVRTPDGYWIAVGHRDAHGVADCQFPWHHGAEAAREGG